METIRSDAASAAAGQVRGAAHFTAFGEGENPVISFTIKKCASHHDSFPPQLLLDSGRG